MKMILPREFYLPLKNETLTQVDAQGTDCVVYTYENGETVLAIGFVGRAAKPAFHHNYGKSAERRAKHIADFFAGRKATLEFKAKRAAEKKEALSKPQPLVVGDILRASWGYEQTNIDFYQVVATSGRRTVKVRKIGYATKEETGYMTGTCTPAPDAFIGEPLTRMVDAYNGINIESYARASKWCGQPERWSSYA